MGFYDRCELGICSMLLGGAFLIISSATSIWLTIPGVIFFFLGVVLINTGLYKLRINIDILAHRVENLDFKVHNTSNRLEDINKRLKALENAKVLNVVSKEDEDKFFPEEK